MKVKHIFEAGLLLCLVACTSKNDIQPAGSERCSVKVRANHEMATRVSYDDENLCAKWAAGEQIGVTAACNGTFTDGILQCFTGQNSVEATSAEFEGTLTECGAGSYALYAISPYKPSMHSACATLNLPQIQYPSASGWDISCDFMVGASESQNVSSVAEATGSIAFSHKMGWLCLSFSGFGTSQSEQVQYVRVSCSDAAIAGDFTVNLTAGTISTANASDKFIIADYSDKNINLGDLKAYITMFPGNYSSIDIAVKTSGHYIECTRTGLNLAAGEMKSATVNFDSNKDSNGTSQSSLTSADLPSMSSKTEGDNLNVLLIGHSFGIDCSQHLPGLLDAAGITNLSLSRFMQSDGQLDEYWSKIKTNTSPEAFHFVDNHTWGARGNTVNQAMKDTSWDVIILQQSTCDGRGQTGPDWGGAANYSTYQPWLALILEYIVSTQKFRQDNIPFIVWNMIDVSKTDYDQKYEKLTEATATMKAATGIKLILTPATSMLTARTDENSLTKYGWDFTDAGTYHMLCRDVNGTGAGSFGWHASEGLGRYLQACTWFEQLICPIYKAADESLTVVGNTYRPTDKTTGGWTDDNDLVTDGKAAALQAIAHATKTNNPFSATNPI